MPDLVLIAALCGDARGLSMRRTVLFAAIQPPAAQLRMPGTPARLSTCLDAGRKSKRTTAMMNKILFLGLAAATLTISGPSAAAPWDGRFNIDQRRMELERRIDRGVREGALTRSETQRLRAGLNRISYLENRYRSFGFSREERRDLNNRLDRLSAQIQAERNDGQYRRG